MLKLNFHDARLEIFKVSTNLETAITQRVLVALQSGQTLITQPGTASFLVSANHSGIKQISTLVDVDRADVDCSEVTLKGVWLYQAGADGEGIFFTSYPDAIEALLLDAWYNEALPAPSLS